LLPDPLESQPVRREHLGGHAATLADEPEQEVLGPEKLVPELQCLA
jgi:hypothetical protein